MAKLIKDGKNYNIITDGDVVVTAPSKIGKTLDEVLIEQQSEIDRLKSNIKYIYSYIQQNHKSSSILNQIDEKDI